SSPPRAASGGPGRTTTPSSTERAVTTQPTDPSRAPGELASVNATAAAGGAARFAATPASGPPANPRTADATATADPEGADPSSGGALPARLGRYHVLGQLGAGGMGVVFA